MATILDGLYASYEILNSATASTDDKRGAYQVLLQGIKDGGIPEKRLSAKFLVQFSPHYPTFQEELFNLLVDLCDSECDDENEPNSVAQINLLHNDAILALRMFCTHHKTFVPKVASIIVQLMAQCEDAKTSLGLQKQLREIVELDAVGAVEGILRNIKRTLSVTDSGVDDPEQRLEERQQYCHVLATALKRFGTSVPPAVEDLIQKELMSAMNEATERDYAMFMEIFSQLSSMSTLTARSKLIETMSGKLVAAHPILNIDDPDCLSSYVACIDRICPLLSKNIVLRRILDAILQRVKSLTQLCISQSESFQEASGRLLRHLAILSSHAKPVAVPGGASLEDAESQVLKKSNLQLKIIVKSIADIIPSPNAAATGSSTATDDDTASSTTPEVSSSLWKCLECLLLTLYNLAGKCWPQLWQLGSPFPSEAESACVLWNGLRPRLQYCALLSQKVMREAPADQISSADKKVLENVQTLLRELLRPENRVNYRPELVMPSWNPVVATTTATPSASNITPIQFSSDNKSADRKRANPPGNNYQRGKQARFSAQNLYRPTGKFEHSLGSIPESTSARGRGNQKFGGFGGNRGRPYRKF